MARVCVDSTYFEVDGLGQLTIVQGSLGYQATAEYLVPGAFNFTKADYPGAKWLYVECIGGGGGGAGASGGAATGSCRGGGGGGGYSASWIDADTIAAVVAVNVGQGGLAGPADTAGGNGFPSTFGVLVRAEGGFGSQPSMAVGTLGADVGGFGANAGVGQVAKRGESGDSAIMLSATVKVSGKGGMSGWNGPGGAAVSNTGPGLVGQAAYGGGGSGAAAFNTSNPGGAGAGGQVRVTVYR